MKIYHNEDLWRYLGSTDKTVVMYGMGNGADKILNICDRYGIEVSDFFASDGFVRGHCFHGKTVISYSDVKAKYGAENIIVLLSFASSLPDVLTLFDRVDSECEMYAPDVPVCGNNLFCTEFFEDHRGEFEQVYNMLEDEESKFIFESVINYKLSGKISYLRDAISDRDEVWSLLGEINTAADLGAYNGDTVRELKKYRPSAKKVIALEPDRRNFRKLSEYALTETDIAVETINAAAWNCEATLTFADSGSRNSGAFAKGKTVEVNALPLDGILCGEGVDYIKYDVEGAEKEALEGSKKTVEKFSPALLVSLYHRSEDMFALPLQIKEMNADYKFYLRRYPYVPAWDLNLICVKNK